MTELIFALGDFIEWTFGLVEFFKALPNKLFIAIGFIGIIGWCVVQYRYIRQGDK